MSTSEPVSLDKDALRPLLHKRDRPGLVRMATQLTWFLASAGAVVVAAAQGSALQWVAVVSAGVALATFFPPMHEASHGTAFATPWLNRATMWWCALMMLEPPTFFEAFHWQHHRKTQDVEQDPEIAAAPHLLDGWPTNPAVYLALVSGQMLLVGKAMFTLACAFMPSASAWEKIFPYVRARKRRRIAWEARILLVLFVAGIWAGLTWVPGFATLLWAWPIGHVVLGFYLMPEHTGLGHEGSQNERTRTVTSNALVRWLMWNMPYHTVHHVHPAVPFHAVPEVHRQLAPHLDHVETGYLAFHAEAARRAFTFGRR